MVHIILYQLMESYQVDVYNGYKIINSYNVLFRSYDSIGKIRRFIKQYDIYKLKNETGVII